ncbi:MAG: PqqD family protein [Bacteroidales bacterium]|nr:PqqD family protein [Bacteroidales bacterium]MDD3521955.1 PqqD family protein [Bacteroidales bacterium]MDD4030618.1 PqqD family protein [Bacteroidales bacterium]MDD4434693.1 PqqD family protein [Bacteroidales bacterium]MDD5733015.1 PqqD family protein [Bacteroidales bacterium]
MKIKESIRIKQIGDEKILVSDNGNNLDYTRIISMNQSAAFLVEESMGKEFTVQEWAHRLTGRYGIDHAQALSDAQKVADKLMQAGVLCE